MITFAEILPSFPGYYCTTSFDQSFILPKVWLGLFVASLVSAAILFVLRSNKPGMYFASLTLLLGGLRWLNPVDACGHGGLFQDSQRQAMLFVSLTTLFVGGFAFVVLRYLYSKRTISRR